MPDRDLWQTPPIQSVAGLNTAVVFGANFASALPINFQLALGSNLQLCLNPSAFSNLSGAPALPAPQTLAQITGAGLGGNMQFTLGTSTNFVIGQSYDINIGPRRVVVDVHDLSGINKPVQDCAVILVMVTVFFELCYMLYDKDDARAVLVGLWIISTQVILMFMMAFQTLNNTADAEHPPVYRGVHQAGNADPDQQQFTAGSYTGLIITWAILWGLILPVILVSYGESQLDQSQAHNA